MFSVRQNSFASYSYRLKPYRRCESKEYGHAGTGHNRGRIARNTHIIGISRVVSSINSPSPELFRTCRPHGNIRRTWLVPLRRTSVRPALRPRRGPSWSVSYELRGARATGIPQKGEESINIHGCGKPRLFISCSLLAYVADRAKASARNCFYLLSSRENRNAYLQNG